MVDPTKKQPGQMDHDQLQDKPSFFTIIREGHNTNRMKIPPNFLKYLDENMRNAILTGSSGDQWQVTVLKNGNDKYLQNGWPQFVRDNSVMHQEFLLFTYNGENRFQVQIFRRNGCERPSSKKLKLKQEAAATPSVVRAKRGRGRPRKTPAASIR